MPTTSLNASRTSPAASGMHLVDLRRAPRSCAPAPVMPPIRDPETATPSAHATTSTAAALSSGAADGVDGAGRLPGDPVPDPRADELEQALPQRRGQDHDEQRAERDQQRRVGVAERDRRQPDAEQPAEQQPGRREGAGDEALPVAGEGVGETTSTTSSQSRKFTGSRRRCEVGVRRRQVLEVLGVMTPAADQHVVGQLLHGRVGQVLDPAEVLEEPGDDAGGEPPADDVVVVADQEARAAPARHRAVDRDPVRGVAQLGERHPVDGVHLVGRDHAHRRWARATSRGPG